MSAVMLMDLNVMNSQQFYSDTSKVEINSRNLYFDKEFSNNKKRIS